MLFVHEAEKEAPTTRAGSAVGIGSELSSMVGGMPSLWTGRDSTCPRRHRRPLCDPTGTRHEDGADGACVE